MKKYMYLIHIISTKIKYNTFFLKSPIVILLQCNDQH